MLRNFRQRIAAAGRQLAHEGLVWGTAGNLSVRVDNSIVITATGSRFDKLDHRQMVIIDMRDGHVIWGKLKPSSELALHLGIYRDYESAGAVVHTHSPWATTVACAVDELPCVHYQMLPLGGAVRVARYQCFGTTDLVRETLKALEGRTAALMANHGAVVYDNSLEQAVESTLILEYAARLYWQSSQLATPRVLNSSQWHDVSQQVRKLDYGSLHPLETRRKD